MIQAARERAAVAYTELAQVARELSILNATAIARGIDPVTVGQYTPPNVALPGASADDIVRALDAQARWYASERDKLRALLARAAQALAPVPLAELAPAPRRVPVILRFAEVAREPWRWLRWLLFPPVAMLVALPIGALAMVSLLGAALVIVVAMAALWGRAILLARRRIALLERGEVATILQRKERRTATFSRNVPALRARGWSVTVEPFTGHWLWTELVVQSSRAVIGAVRVRHAHPFDGVVLIHPETAQGEAHIDLGSVPQPDGAGQWTSSLNARVWLTSLCGVAMSLGFFALAALLLRGALEG